MFFFIVNKFNLCKVLHLFPCFKCMLSPNCFKCGVRVSVLEGVKSTKEKAY